MTSLDRSFNEILHSGINLRQLFSSDDFTKGICLANGIGVVDSDYRGEIKVALFNTSDEAFTVRDGDRIAQLMFMPVMQAEFIASEDLGQTGRGAGGFGSTGIG